MTPFTVKVFKLFLCIFACEKCFCTPLDLSHEAKELLESHGINNTNSDVMKVAKNFVLERREAKNNITLIERERERERSDAFHYKGKLDAMQIEKNSETVKVKIRDVAIGYRSRIERLENLLFPPWLLSTKLTREQRFFIASTIYTTKYSGVLHDRLDNETLGPSDYAMALQEIYGDLSNRFEHFQKTHRVPETDEEWKALFEYLELVDEYQKKAMKVSLPGLPVPPKKLSTGENRYFVLLDNVDFKVTEQDVEMLFSSAVDPQGKTNICMIKKFKGLPSGFVAVDFVTKLSKTIEELEDNLESYKQPPFDKKKVNARVYIEP